MLKSSRLSLLFLAMVVVNGAVVHRAHAQRAPVMEVPRSWNTTVRDKPFVVYAEHFKDNGEDWGKAINDAIDAVAANRFGGEVVLPPSHLDVSTTIDLRADGTTAKGIILRGGGGATTTTLSWVGCDNKAVINMAYSWYCQIRNLEIHGNGNGAHHEQKKKSKGVIGIRYDAGRDRGTNGGKFNSVESVVIDQCDIGVKIGDKQGPDLVSTSFRNLQVANSRIGIEVIGANVATIQFYNLILTNYCETGIHSISGAGSPEIIVYGLNTQTQKNVFKRSSSTCSTIQQQDQWLIVTDGGAVRIYSARIEGEAGVLKFTSNGGGNRFNCMLVDVSGGPNAKDSAGNAIEFQGQGPLYLVGCTFAGNVAVASTQVFSTGTFFRDNSEGFVVVPDPGGGRHWPVLHENHTIWQGTHAVPTGNKSIAVVFPNEYWQADYDYQVVVTPGWDAGFTWVTDKDKNGFKLHFSNAAPSANITADVLVTRKPFR